MRGETGCAAAVLTQRQTENTEVNKPQRHKDTEKCLVFLCVFVSLWLITPCPLAHSVSLAAAFPFSIATFITHVGSPVPRHATTSACAPTLKIVKSRMIAAA